MSKKTHMNASELAEKAGCATSTITRAIAKGELKAKRRAARTPFLIRMRDADAFLKSMR